MEGRASLGQYEPAGGTYTLHTSTQDPFGIRLKLATKAFHEPVAKFRVISPDVGGGFGMKGDCYPEDVLVLWASRRCGGDPVKWVSTRAEALMSDCHGRDQVISAEMALDESGKILAVRTHALDAVGAYTAGAQMAQRRSTACASPRGSTTSARCTRWPTRSSPTPRRWCPTAAPAARRPPISSSG